MKSDDIWVNGPLELLKRSIPHSKNGTDFDNRIAMISIDNAVEITLKN